jgi:prolycopene isomerase
MPPARDRYDIVVVGAGLGGISAGAVLARAGRSVLVVERQDAPGGCARSLRRGGYVFDLGVHMTVEAGPGRLLDRLLDWLGVAGACSFVQSEHLYRTQLPGFGLRPPANVEACIAAHQDALPADRAGIKAFFELQQRFFGELVHLGMSVGLDEIGAAVERFPTFFRNRNATLGDVLDDTVGDPRAKAVLGSAWPYWGLPPSRLGFAAFSPFLGVLLGHGPSQCTGGFQRMADAFALALERHGGELLTGTGAESVRVEDGRAAGVVLAGGDQVRAGTVISNADALHTFEELVGLEHVPGGYARRLRRYELATSAYVVFAATRLPVQEMDVAPDNFLFGHWDHDDTWQDVGAGVPGGMWASIPTLADPSLAPAGEHVVIMTSLAPYEAPSTPERFAEQVVARFDEGLLPGLRDELTHLEAAGPADIERHTGNSRGAIYGWAVTPRQSASKRLGHASPVPGLWLSGHWTEEGPGSFRTVLSGLTTARMILAADGDGEDLPSFRPEDLPQELIGG